RPVLFRASLPCHLLGGAIRVRQPSQLPEHVRRGDPRIRLDARRRPYLVQPVYGGLAGCAREAAPALESRPQTRLRRDPRRLLHPLAKTGQYGSKETTMVLACFVRWYNQTRVKDRVSKLAIRG